MTHEHYLRPPTREEFLGAREVALSLRKVAKPGTEAGMMLHHLSNALGQDPTMNAWAPIVMRAMVDRAHEILGDS